MAEIVRLNKFLAERLGISRREADNAIAAGKVTIDGATAELGARIEVGTDDGGSGIDKNPNVCYNGKMVPFEAAYLYVALNKPRGVVCSRRSQGGEPTVYDLLPEECRELKTVGRLDKDSSGLILLTNDGDFAFRMTHPRFTKTKIYEVELDRALDPLHQQEIADFGIEIGDGVSKLGLAKLDETRKKWQVTMHEGRNRQIRRTFGALGYTVVELKRMQFGAYRLDGLEEGGYTEVKAV